MMAMSVIWSTIVVQTHTSQWLLDGLPCTDVHDPQKIISIDFGDRLIFLVQCQQQVDTYILSKMTTIGPVASNQANGADIHVSLTINYNNFDDPLTGFVL